MFWADHPEDRRQPGWDRRRLTDDDRRLVAALQQLDAGLSPVNDQLIAGELTWADRLAEMVRGRIIDGTVGGHGEVKKVWQTCGTCKGSGKAGMDSKGIVIYCGTCGGDGGWWVNA